MRDSEGPTWPRRRDFMGAAAACCAAPVLATPAALTGIWSGFLAADDPPALLTLRIMEAASAELVVVGMGTVPVARFSAQQRRVQFGIDRPPLSFDGELDGSGDLVGTLTRGAERIPLTFVRGDLYTEPTMAPLPPGPVTAERLQALRTAARCPAMGVAWQAGERPAQVLVDGQRSVRHTATVQPTDLWHLGSVTKSMTATLAARLVERGRLDWTTPLHELLGTRLPGMHAGYRDLHLLHLLSHRGGLMRDASASAYLSLPAAEQRVAYARAALASPPQAAPGERMVYSNADYVVAGLVLEVVGGADWEALIAAELMRPLGITGFGFGPPGAADGLGQPQGHRMGPRGLEPVRSDVPFALGPAGRVHMALADLIVYLAAHRDRPAGFLKPASWARLHTPPFGGQHALGWDVGPGGVLSHGGTNGWWKSEVRIDPARGWVGAAVTNVLNNNGQQALLQLLDAARAC